MRFSTLQKSRKSILYWWCYRDSNVNFLLIAFCQVFHHNKFIFHLHIAFFFSLHFFHLFALLCSCFQTCFHSISLRLLSANSRIDTRCTRSIKLVVNNSRFEWISMRSSLCLFILQIQREQRLNDFLMMLSILLTMCLSRNAIERSNIERASRLHHNHSEFSTILLFLNLLLYVLVKKFDDLRVWRIVLLRLLNFCLKKRTMITISTIFFSYDHTQISSITSQIKSLSTLSIKIMTKRKSHVCSIEEIKKHTRERLSDNAFEFEDLILELDVTTKIWISIIWSLAKKTWCLKNMYCLSFKKITMCARFAMLINTTRNVTANFPMTNTDIAASMAKSHPIWWFLKQILKL